MGSMQRESWILLLGRVPWQTYLYTYLYLYNRCFACSHLRALQMSFNMSKNKKTKKKAFFSREKVNGQWDQAGSQLLGGSLSVRWPCSQAQSESQHNLKVITLSCQVLAVPKAKFSRCLKLFFRSQTDHSH